MKVFELAAVALLRDHEVLNVRKRGTCHVILPGGKVEPGESTLDTALREAAEELGLDLDPASLELLGDFRSAPANDDADEIHCTVYVADWPDGAQARTDHEIAAYEWTDLLDCADDPRQAPLLIDHVIPALRRAGRI
ncbi:NUDIX hydrolase [Propionibacterium australiense]|uniref:NUDIX domain-containing protein n=1 Tax=Propionibacterium australiense TaxID=119981 RepID=A0A383S7F8_9ACTN|nr:NUDIX domain-containing protein [Propionibacterium australiense]RLP08953.1 NUDIX domain-containing protein [Propionibacterium australiense]RLP09114.1 NUDIX domain-containing protein [Propionibacterium australiense]SYZ33492.1 NUDIX hydrolase domain [Propionibacterium australiense]VEH91751.1 Predicted NTP pyrophosphohydrolase [Propionibacterium australiense]